jgi:hypothetical protein
MKNQLNVAKRVLDLILILIAGIMLCAAIWSGIQIQIGQPSDLINFKYELYPAKRFFHKTNRTMKKQINKGFQSSDTLNLTNPQFSNEGEAHTDIFEFLDNLGPNISSLSYHPAEKLWMVVFKKGEPAILDTKVLMNFLKNEEK